MEGGRGGVDLFQFNAMLFGEKVLCHLLAINLSQKLSLIQKMF